VGYKLLNKLGGLLKYIKGSLIPFLGQVKAGFDGIAKDKNSPAAKLGAAVRTMFVAFRDLFGQIGGAKGKEGASALDTIAKAFTNVANGITSVVNALGRINNLWSNIPGPLKYVLTHTPNLYALGKYLSTDNSPNQMTPLNPNSTSADPFGTNGTLGPFKPSSYGMNNSGTTIINLNGIVDAESARRSIEQLLQKSSIRTGAVSTSRTVWSA
jgi:hypothetical protein